MLLNCSSCNTSYLVNSADLQPNGRIVECANCSNQWFQKANIDNQDNVYTFKPSQIDEGIEFLKSADVLVGHNIIGFDIF